MYTNTRFGELMKGLPRRTFSRLVEQTEADKHNKGFRSWDQLVAMIYGQLSGCRSLRELETAFNNHGAHHYHLGTRSLHRSTLSDANSQRDCQVYEQLCRHMLGQVHRQVRREVTDLLYLLDSTPITLKGRGYDDWAQANHNRFTQGLKVHMLYQPERGVPTYSRITAPNVNDIEDARQMAIEAGATYVFDKGYYDYNWWHKLNQQGAKFVTRLKKNAAVVVQEADGMREVDDELAAGGTILGDEPVRFKSRHPRGGHTNHYREPLRRVTVAREEGKAPLVLVTNDLARSAEDIAGLYKARWQIELFFKWLKQNLKIKQFLGRSENAVRTQIYIALITYLLIWLYHSETRQTASLKQCATLLSTSLFQRPETEYQVWRRRQRWRQECLARQQTFL